MVNRTDLARQAYSKAIQERRDAGISPTSPLCAFDLIYKKGIEVRFQNISSMEGLYCNDGKPLIFVSSCRPRGRIAYNCAHEYGHHVFGHGNRIDEVLDQASKNQWEPEEFLADCFAGFLLMPKIAVCKAFSSRGWDSKHCSSDQIFTISGYMGVGYNTLLFHMCYSLQLISRVQYNDLNRVTPKMLKEQLYGETHANDLIIADTLWVSKPIDLCVGDILITPNESIVDGECVEYIGECPKGYAYRACTQGLDRIQEKQGGWASHIRVSRQLYEGLVQYRHFPEE
ncbi:MAG: Zn peptidase [Planctomycetota bacterium]|nr:MAG: Zn peptidase [Planctomycetota bacterium]